MFAAQRATVILRRSHGYGETNDWQGQLGIFVPAKQKQMYLAAQETWNDLDAPPDDRIPTLAGGNLSICTRSQ